MSLTSSLYPNLALATSNQSISGAAYMRRSDSMRCRRVKRKSPSCSPSRSPDPYSTLCHSVGRARGCACKRERKK